MSTNRDPRRSIAAWLEGEAPDRAPGRLIDASRERIRSTPQRRAWWPAWRATDMNSFAKWAIAAAAVIVVAIVGYNLLPSPAGTAIQAAGASPSTAAATSAVPSANPSPAVGAVCTLTPVKFDPTAGIDLTGAWAGNDGGIYYVRQRGNVIWWNGMSSRNDPPESLGRNWNNVGRGEINADLTIVADWADVPRGLIDGYGTVTFKVGADGAGDVQITKMSETGTGRDDTTWSRCEPGFPG